MTEDITSTEQSRVAADCPNERLVIRCTITKKEILETPLTDDFAIPRMLIEKGFKADGGPLQPKLRGQIGYTVDFETGDYRYFQIGI